MDEESQRENLLRLLDGELPPGEAERVRKELLSGPMAGELRRQERLSTLLQRAYGVAPTAPEAAAFQRELEARVRAEAPVRRPWWQVLWGNPWSIAAQAACLLLFAVVGYGLFDRATPVPIAPAPTVASAENPVDVDEIDADANAITWQLPDSNTTVVLFTWNDDNKTTAPASG